MLKVILGRSGYGKTEYVFNSIKRLVNEGKSIVLITPEQYSYVAEKRLLKELGEADMGRVQSLSFSRLNDEISSVYGGDALPILSKGAKAVMMHKASLMVKDSLVLYGNNVNQNSFINSFSSVYDEMKSCRVDVSDILDASVNALDSGKRILSDKLKDIATLIEAYDSLISGKYLDCADNLTRLYEKLCNIDYFKNKIVFIDGFSGFVAQEYKIIEVILKQAEMTYITLCNDTYMPSVSNDLFYYVSRNYEILKGVCTEAGIRFSEPLILKENSRAGNDELRAVESNAYCNIKSKKPYNDEVSNVRIYSALNVFDECDHTASEIVKLLRKGYRASDITVICRDLNKYKNELQFSFSKYNVPYYNDERQEITSQPIIMFVNFLLRVAIYSRRSEDIFALLKTGLTSLDNNSISELENYVYLWNISGSKWNSEFSGSVKGLVDVMSDNDRNQLNAINNSRAYVASKINKFINSSRKKCCKDICRAIYYAIVDFDCDEGLRRLAIELDNAGSSSLAKEQGRVWDLLMQILDKLAMVGGEEEISLKEFYKLFNLMISNEDLGTIPMGLDNIQIGSADRIRCDNPRVVFMLGANEGAFPLAVTSFGLFTEEDRFTLINNNFKLYSYSEILNAQEKYFAYMSMTSAKERLYVSYLNDEVASSIISEITTALPKIKIEKRSNEISLDSVESKDNAFELLASNLNVKSTFVSSLQKYFSREKIYAERMKAIRSLTDNDDISIDNTEVTTQLFHKDMNLSASRIEDYYNCPFAYFCKFGINAKPRKRAELDPMQAGTVIHYVLEQIVKNKGKTGLCAMNKKDISADVEKYLSEFLDNLMSNSEEFTPRLKYQFMRLSRMLVRVVERLRDEFEHSDFEAKAFELKIGDGSENEPVKSKVLKLPDGGSISIRGAIDRVDTYVENGKQYVRVVDYKSGEKNFDLADIMYGINLQMFIYLFTLCESDYELAGISAGVLYLKSARKVLSYDKRVNSSTIKDDEGKDFRMFGVVLNDDDNPIAEHMEHELEGRYIPVSINAKNAMVGDFVSLEELGRISRKIDSLVTEMGMRLHSGKINQSPIQLKKHRFPCEFCDYKAVCNNRVEIEPRVVDALKSDEVLRILREEDCDA